MSIGLSRRDFLAGAMGTCIAAGTGTRSAYAGLPDCVLVGDYQERESVICTGQRIKPTYSHHPRRPTPGYEIPWSKFDITDRVKEPMPHNARPRRVPLETLSGAATLYQKINLMGAMLHGIPYLRLYDETQAEYAHNLFRTWAQRLEEFHAEKQYPQNTGEICVILRAMADCLESHFPHITLRYVYLAQHEHDPVVQHIVTEFRKICYLSGYLLCVPFAVMNKSDACIDDFLDRYGTYDYRQLYTHASSRNRRSNGTAWPPPGKSKKGNRNEQNDNVGHPFDHAFLSMPPQIEFSSEGRILRWDSDDFRTFLDEQKCESNGSICGSGGTNCTYTSSDCFCSIAEGGGCSIASCCDE